jgi:hypothetical protein
VWLPPAYGEIQNAARGHRRAVLYACLLRLARLLERSVDRQTAISCKIAKRETAPQQALLQVELPIPLEVSRGRFPLMGSRSVGLDKGLSSPLLCTPARRPAHLLGCSACLASPQLLAQLLASGRHSASPVYPSCMYLPGAAVPTRGTSHWGHPRRVERGRGPWGAGFALRASRHHGTNFTNSHFVAVALPQGDCC